MRSGRDADVRGQQRRLDRVERFVVERAAGKDTGQRAGQFVPRQRKPRFESLGPGTRIRRFVARLALEKIEHRGCAARAVDGRAQSCDSTGSAPNLSKTRLPIARAQRVRIIGGRCRGRVIRFPAALELRPTPDRVRETLFNWLGQDLTGRSTLDLFCGTGVLSLEALSRGAECAVAVDRDPRLIRALERTAASMEIGGLETHVVTAEMFLSRESRKFDVVFLDPPFDTDPWDWLLPRSLRALTSEGFAYAEARRPLEPPPGAALRRHAK